MSYLLEVKQICWLKEFTLGAQHLNSYSLKESRVPERKLHHLFDLSQLLSTASDVIVADVIQALLFIL